MGGVGEDGRFGWGVSHLCLVHFMTAQFLSVHLQHVMADKMRRRRDMVRGRGL